VKPVVGITQEDIVTLWDRVAELRVAQITNGKDLSFNYILVPTVLRLSAHSDFTTVLDIGCGPGFLTRLLASKAQRLTGIDMSGKMIDLAQKSCGNLGNVELVHSTIEGFAANQESPPFTLAIANMSLMSMIELDKVLHATARLLKRGGHFIFTITHPCFWPFYWGYASEDWFDYREELVIEGTFKISLDTRNRGRKTVHVHRSMERYLASLSRAGFIIDSLREPMPAKEVEMKYPRRWKYPRFLGMRCIKKRALG
jgi:SAM-dependent methyltransferase